MAILIKHGNTYTEIECNECNALLGYTKKDINRKENSFEIFGEINFATIKWVDCQECGNKIYLSYIINGEETGPKDKVWFLKIFMI